MTDPEARRYMLFLSASYQLLAPRAEERKERLAGPLGSGETTTDLPDPDPRRTDTSEAGE